MTQSKGGVVIAAESPDQGAVNCMMRESDRYFASLYADDENHLLDLGELERPEVTFLVARCDGVIAGFGALVRCEDAQDGPYGELKRIYVPAAMRGMGVGRMLVDALEEAAQSQGLSLLRLETGTLQPEALGLYRAAGYVERGPFGDYPPAEVSLFFEKRLA